MASKTGKLVLGSATALLIAACQTGPLTNAPSMGLDRQSQGGYGVQAVFDTTSDCPDPRFAVWANSQSEWLHFTGSRNTINGNVHTNDLFKMAGNNDRVIGTSEAVDGFSISGNKTNTAGTETAGAVERLGIVKPVEADESRIRRITGDVTLQGDLGDLVYIATGKITISSKGARGKATLIAREIQFAGNNTDLQPATGHKVLAYATGTGANALHIAGNSGSYRGVCFSQGGFQLTGHQNELTGLVVCETFKLAGSKNTINCGDETLCPTPAPTPSAPSSTKEPGEGEQTELPSPSPSPTATPTPSPSPTEVPTPAPTPAPGESPFEGEEPTEPSPSPVPSPSTSVKPGATG